jgi:hypothetical protein
MGAVLKIPPPFSLILTCRKDVTMGKYVLKRLVYIVIVFFIISFLMYAIYNIIPTDPARYSPSNN